MHRPSQRRTAAIVDCWKSCIVGLSVSLRALGRAAVDMGIYMGIPMGMVGMGWVWGLWWIPMGLWGFYGDFPMDVRFKRKRVKHAINVPFAVLISLNTVRFVICFTGIFFIFLSLLNTHRPNSLHIKLQHVHLTKRHRVWGMGIDDFGVLWVWGFCGGSHSPGARRYS